VDDVELIKVINYIFGDDNTFNVNFLHDIHHSLVW